MCQLNTIVCCVWLCAAVLLPGFYVAEISTAGAVRRTASCPQKYYCSGGVATAAFDPLNPAALPATEATIKLCANGTWTIGLGSTSAAQCRKYTDASWYRRRAKQEGCRDTTT